MNLRIGQSIDIHRVSADPERPLVLGGITFDGPGLIGHSDADVVAHAVIDALLSAAGLGDIGEVFPDTDPDLRDADSIVLLERAVGFVSSAGWSPVNVDCTVVADYPQISPRRADMERRLSDTVGAPVTVKGRRTEGVGSLGNGDAVVCLAVALITAK